MTLTLVDTEQLTRREREIVALMMLGDLTDQALAQRLTVTEHTIHFHVASVMRKFEVSRRGQVVSYAWQHGAITQGEWWPTLGRKESA
jgi:two-component system, NarL family, nitrate/nitrite response regulator NarL